MLYGSTDTTKTFILSVLQSPIYRSRMLTQTGIFVSKASELTAEQKKRASLNRSIALKKVKNPKIQPKKSNYISDVKPQASITSREMTEEQKKRASINRNIALKKLKDQKIQCENGATSLLTSGPLCLPGSEASSSDDHENGILWTLLPTTGLDLKNTLNKCWYHATLHLLTANPLIRNVSLSVVDHLNSFEQSLCLALQSIFRNGTQDTIHDFFLLVRDFTGISNRYGQVAVPDFLEYLCNNSPSLSKMTGCTFHNMLQCSNCKWVSVVPCMDVSLKLYVPPGLNQQLLSDLVTFNSNAVLSTKDIVFCGHCNAKTPHQSSREYDPDIFFIEIIRAFKKGNKWIKNPIRVSFPAANVQLPGFARTYIASCHHRGYCSLWALVY
jgi:hypothetical protein